MKDPIEQWVRPEIRALDSYPVPDAGGLLKLDAMENPYTWPDELRQAWLERLAGVDVNRYPDPQAQALKQRLRATMGIPAEAGLILGNGSDELIQMLAMTVASPTRTLLSVEPGFVMYRMIASFCGMRYLGVDLEANDFGLPLDALLAAIEQQQPPLIFLAYPNNPTGNLFREEALLRVIEAAPGLVVIDEAYTPFTDHSFLPRLGEHANLLVMRTVSKMGLAGLRLGYLAGPSPWLDQVEKLRLPYNINVLTQLSADFALQHLALFNQQTEQIRADRERLFAALKEIPGIRPYPSQANFILLRLTRRDAPAVFEGLKQAGILVKNLHGAHPLLAQCLRITVGTAQENAALLQALRELS